MAVQHEEAFETELCAYLASAGWECSPNDKGYDRDRALFPADVFAWLEATQPEQLDKLVKPGAPEASRELGRKQILDRIIAAQATDTMNGGGTLAVLKSSVSVLSAKFSLFQKRPANELNPKTLEDFAANRLRVMRQVRYSGKNSNRIDLVLFVNGIPVSTIELKTDLTQDLAAGLKQYAQDRKPAGEPLLTFGRGALVHFVVTNEEVHMTTKLDGTSTRFLTLQPGQRQWCRQQSYCRHEPYCVLLGADPPARDVARSPRPVPALPLRGEGRSPRREEDLRQVPPLPPVSPVARGHSPRAHGA